MDLGYDDGTTPTLGFVRLRLALAAAGGPVGAHVRVMVTGNDLREKDFAADLKAVQSRFDTTTYDLAYPAGSRIAPYRIKEMLPYLWHFYHEVGPRFVNQHGKPALMVEIPPGTTVYFNGAGQYILVDGGAVVWSSVAYAEAKLEPRHPGEPAKKASDPQGSVTIKYADDP